MARIFITGSSDGLGLIAGRLLAANGHAVVLHARNARRAEDARAALPECEDVVIGDVSTIAAMGAVADQANATGRFDAVIHNVALGYQEPGRGDTADGLARLFAVNVLAPYVLTAKMQRPDRLIYMSSGMHSSGDPSIADLQWDKRRWQGMQAYSDSKLHDLLLALGVARRWPDVLVNAVDPGWVPTKMGGRGAPGDLIEGGMTQAWLAVSDDAAARVTGGYFHHQRPRRMSPHAGNVALQDRLIEACERLSGLVI